MKKLEETLTLRGPGIPGLQATLKIRTSKVCLYERSDGIYEVFVVQIEKAGKVFGKDMPEREVYPGNEDFGNTAWSYSDLKRATTHYERLLNVNK